MVRQVVVNCCFGGFELSQCALELYHDLTSGVHANGRLVCVDDIRRDDPFLLQVIERLGLEMASGPYCKLGIAEIPDDVPVDGWIVQDYDGNEWVAEVHRTWNARPRCADTLGV